MCVVGCSRPAQLFDPVLCHTGVSTPRDAVACSPPPPERAAPGAVKRCQGRLPGAHARRQATDSDACSVYPHLHVGVRLGLHF